mmetsp:Transcript_12204/g.38141  ORF Transcript_12204/g.38141 Transcript_12204/m.38141 type:complete len:309 (+) Transcript_12204:343-1269(+)
MLQCAPQPLAGCFAAARARPAPAHRLAASAAQENQALHPDAPRAPSASASASTVQDPSPPGCSRSRGATACSPSESCIRRPPLLALAWLPGTFQSKARRRHWSPGRPPSCCPPVLREARLRPFGPDSSALLSRCHCSCCRCYRCCCCCCCWSPRAPLSAPAGAHRWMRRRPGVQRRSGQLGGLPAARGGGSAGEAGPQRSEDRQGPPAAPPRPPRSPFARAGAERCRVREGEASLRSPHPPPPPPRASGPCLHPHRCSPGPHPCRRSRSSSLLRRRRTAGPRTARQSRPEAALQPEQREKRRGLQPAP